MELIFEPILYDLPALLQRAGQLPSHYTAHLATISGDRRRCEWLISRILVHERFGQWIDVRSDGAPVIANGYISISHCQSHVAVIVSQTNPVGIDIEHEQREAAKLSRKFTDETELAVVEPYYPSNPALLIWCAKEALYKLAGVEGAEFRSAFRIVGADRERVQAFVFGKAVELRFFVRDHILCLYTF